MINSKSRKGSFRFWLRDRWTAAKVIPLIAIILFLMYLPLMFYSALSGGDYLLEWESVKNNDSVTIYAIVSFFFGGGLFYYLFFAPLKSE